MFVACGMLSLISVLGIIIILGVCKVSSANWSTKIYPSANSGFRYQWQGAAVLPTKHYSFALKWRDISFPFSYATSFRALALSSTFHGSSKRVSKPAHHALLMRLSHSSVTYAILSLYEGNSVLTPLVIAGWDSDFFICNRRPHL